MYRSIVILLCAMIATGCAATYGTRAWFAPGSTTQAEVRARMGAPPQVWFSKDGTENWDYAANPYSFYAYRASFNEQGVMTQFRSLRDIDDLRRLAPGKSTSQDVKDLFGEPARVYFIRGDPHWEWNVFRPIREPCRMVVQMGLDGVVKSMGVYRIETGGPRLMIGM